MLYETCKETWGGFTNQQATSRFGSLTVCATESDIGNLAIDTNFYSACEQFCQNHHAATSGKVSWHSCIPGDYYSRYTVIIARCVNEIMPKYHMLPFNLNHCDGTSPFRKNNGQINWKNALMLILKISIPLLKWRSASVQCPCYR